jgi:hypothetical protein
LLPKKTARANAAASNFSPSALLSLKAGGFSTSLFW